MYKEVRILIVKYFSENPLLPSNLNPAKTQRMENDSDDPIDDTPFDLQALFDTASKLKSAQLNKIRKEYDSSPGFIKATQLYSERNNFFSDLSLPEKIQKCKEFKLKGNSLYNKTHEQMHCQSNKNMNISKINPNGFMLAMTEYSQAISIFRYFIKCDERGESLALRDTIEDKSIFTNDCNLDERKGIVLICQQLIIDCLLNCAMCCLKLKKHSDLLWCCNTVLNTYDNRNAKAYYYMSISFEQLDTTFDLEYALKYIKSAKDLKPNDKQIDKKYKHIRKILRKQNMKDKKRFRNIFENSNIYDDKNDIGSIEGKNVNGNVCSRLMAMCTVL